LSCYRKVLYREFFQIQFSFYPNDFLTLSSINLFSFEIFHSLNNFKYSTSNTILFSCSLFSSPSLTLKYSLITTYLISGSFSGIFSSSTGSLLSSCSYTSSLEEYLLTFEVLFVVLDGRFSCNC